MRREYKTGSKYALWRWKDISWKGELYLRRLILVQCPLFSVMLHFIKQPDRQRHLHDHPVSMLCVLLKGEYFEDCGHFIIDNFRTQLIKWPDLRLVRWFNWIPHTKKHRIAATSPDGVITLCLAGPRKQEWGFYTEEGWIHWKQYHDMYDASTT